MQQQGSPLVKCAAALCIALEAHEVSQCHVGFRSQTWHTAQHDTTLEAVPVSAGASRWRMNSTDVVAARLVLSRSTWGWPAGVMLMLELMFMLSLRVVLAAGEGQEREQGAARVGQAPEDLRVQCQTQPGAGGAGMEGPQGVTISHMSLHIRSDRQSACSRHAAGWSAAMTANGQVVSSVAVKMPRERGLFKGAACCRAQALPWAASITTRNVALHLETILKITRLTQQASGSNAGA